MRNKPVKEVIIEKNKLYQNVVIQKLKIKFNSALEYIKSSRLSDYIVCRQYNWAKIKNYFFIPDEKKMTLEKL